MNLNAQEAVFYLRWQGFTRKGFGELKESFGFEGQFILLPWHHGKKNIPNTTAKSCHGTERPVDKTRHISESAGVTIGFLIVATDRRGNLPGETNDILEPPSQGLSHLGEISGLLGRIRRRKSQEKQQYEHKAGHSDSHDTLRFL